MHMGRNQAERGTVVLGLALVVIGGLALLGRALSIDILGLGWPLFVLIPGIVLSVQAATGLWATWAYAWALVAPGGVGLAFIVYGLITRQPDLARNGVPILLTGLGLFVAFGLFFEGLLHLSGDALPLAEPVLATGLIVLGAAILVLGAMGRRGRI